LPSLLLKYPGIEPGSLLLEHKPLKADLNVHIDSYISNYVVVL